MSEQNWKPDYPTGRVRTSKPVDLSQLSESLRKTLREGMGIEVDPDHPGQTIVTAPGLTDAALLDAINNHVPTPKPATVPPLSDSEIMQLRSLLRKQSP